MKCRSEPRRKFSHVVKALPPVDSLTPKSVDATRKDDAKKAVQTPQLLLALYWPTSVGLYTSHRRFGPAVEDEVVRDSLFIDSGEEQLRPHKQKDRKRVGAVYKGRCANQLYTMFSYS